MIQTYKLKDVTDIITCGVAKRPDYVKEGCMFLSSQNVKKDKLILNRYEKISEEDYQKLTKINRPQNGDVLYTRVGSFGEAAVVCVAEPFAIYVSLTLIRPKHSILYNRFLMHYLNSPQVKFIAENSTRGIGVQNLNVDTVRDFDIILPCMSSQIQIVQILDIAQSLIDKRKEQIKACDELIKSQFVEMFGVYLESKEVVDLIEVSEKITDGEHGTVNRVEKGIPYLMARNITRDNQLYLSEVSYIDKETHNKIYSRCNPEYDDLMIVCVGATIGKTVLVPSMEEFSIARSVALVKYNRQLINGKYILWLFNMEYMQRQLKNSSNESAQAGLYIGKIKELKIPVPPLALQNQFAFFAQQVEQQKSLMKQSLTELENNFNSLMQRAFNGELFPEE